jgi:hypothetical protein
LRDLLTGLPSLGKFFQDDIKRFEKQGVRNSYIAVDVPAQSSLAEIEARCQLGHAAPKAQFCLLPNRQATGRLYSEVMSSETRQTLTLYRALKNCGGEAELAKALDVSIESLSRWLTGHEAPSVKVYMAALSLVAARRIKTR